MKTITLTQSFGIIQIHDVSSSRQGTLVNTKASEITDILGFKPVRYSKEDGDGKVTTEWEFEIAGKKFAIWDYKGSASFGQFSTFGDSFILNQLFGEKFDPTR